MSIDKLIHKIRNRLWYHVSYSTANKKIHPYLYRSFWHFMLTTDNKQINDTCYFSARPNPGAGIGHQMANWITGYWFAKQFGQKFAHIPFSTKKWDDFFGFGEEETTVEELVKTGYKIRKLPLFNQLDPKAIAFTKSIVQSYAGKKVVCITEQDQNTDEFDEVEQLKQKFRQAATRKNDRLIYAADSFNIACHVRRGDIAEEKHKNDPSFTIRWLNTDYYTTVLSQVLKNVEVDKPIAIYLFSEGDPKDFQEFDQFPNIHLCLDMDAQNSFLHMMYADILITSKSSFSFIPALMNDAIKVCPDSFWFDYPDEPKWIVTDDNGAFDEQQLKQVQRKIKIQ